MGCDCASQVPVLFLYWYEHDYMSSGVTNNNNIMSKLKYCSRYIDDLNIPNYNQDICNIVSNDIYPKELDIVCINVNNNIGCTFLDLDIIVENNRFITIIYDKQCRRGFSFKVVSRLRLMDIYCGII